MRASSAVSWASNGPGKAPGDVGAASTADAALAGWAGLAAAAGAGAWARAS
jgi:hypothetical protein